MIGQSGIAIFIFGNKKDNGEIVIADGMLKEFEIAKKYGKIIIPVGSTGTAAALIYEEVKANIEQYPYLECYLEKLGKETDKNQLIETIYKIINSQQLIREGITWKSLKQYGASFRIRFLE